MIRTNLWKNAVCSGRRQVLAKIVIETAVTTFSCGAVNENIQKTCRTKNTKKLK